MTYKLYCSFRKSDTVFGARTRLFCWTTVKQYFCNVMFYNNNKTFTYTLFEGEKEAQKKVVSEKLWGGGGGG